jgi:hypothetical protein
MILLCMQSLNMITCMDLCNYLLQDMISWIYLQDNNAQTRIWLRLLHRSTQEISHKIYFVFL